MKNRVLWIVLLVIALIGVAAFSAWLTTQQRRQAEDLPPVVAEDTPIAEQPAENRREVVIYFAGSDGRLHGERSEIPAHDDPTRLANEVLTLLLAGPTQPSLMPALPTNVELGGVWLLDDGVAFVDLRLPEDQPIPSVGSAYEFTMLYSLVNTVSENVPGVTAVAPMWNGRQPLTFAGHIDTSEPIAPDRSMIATP
ncbi:MAG: GerMN domain-containing protein [Acidobacteriota bacterium]